MRVSGASKSRLVKAAGAEVCRQRRNQKLHASVARSAFSSENVKKTDGLGPLFEVPMSKNCTPLWRRSLSSENVQNTSGSDHFLKF